MDIDHRAPNSEPRILSPEHRVGMCVWIFALLASRENPERTLTLPLFRGLRIFLNEGSWDYRCLEYLAFWGGVLFGRGRRSRSGRGAVLQTRGVKNSKI